MLTETLKDIEYCRLLRVDAVCAATGWRRSTLYRRVADRLWPRAVKLGPRSVGWPSAEIAALNGARIAGKTDDNIRLLVQKLEAARTTLDIDQWLDERRVVR